MIYLYWPHTYSPNTQEAGVRGFWGQGQHREYREIALLQSQIQTEKEAIVLTKVKETKVQFFFKVLYLLKGRA